MKKILFIFLLFYNPLYAQESISFQELGLSFDIPKGWSGQLQEDYYVLGHQTIPGLMILFQNTSTSANELRSLAMEGVYDEGVQLSPIDEFELIGNNKIEGFYSGTFGGTNVKCFAIGLINSRGSGLNVLILTEKDKFSDSHISEAKKLATTVQFFQGSDTELTQEWKSKLINRQLKYLYTSSSTDYSGGYTGVSDKTIIKLYPNNTFYFYSNSNASFSTGDAPGGFGYTDATKSNKGDYKIYSIANDTYLELHFEDDRIYEYSLTSSDDGSTLLNGNRYFVIGINE